MAAGQDDFLRDTDIAHPGEGGQAVSPYLIPGSIEALRTRFLSTPAPSKAPSTNPSARPTMHGNVSAAPGRRLKPRKLILCFDGTGNKFHGNDSDSNILKIFRMLDREANDQYHYYQREYRESTTPKAWLGQEMLILYFLVQLGLAPTWYPSPSRTLRCGRGSVPGTKRPRTVQWARRSTSTSWVGTAS